MKLYKIILVAVVLAFVGGLAHDVKAQEYDDALRQQEANRNNPTSATDVRTPPSATGVTTPPSATDVTTPATSNAFPTLQNPLRAKSLTNLIFSVVDIIIYLGVIVAVFVFIFIGFKLVVAQGDPKALEEARSFFLHAVIGTAILISSKVIVEVVKSTLVSSGVVEQKLFDYRP